MAGRPTGGRLSCRTGPRQAGSGAIVIPCNTAHGWFDEMQAAAGLPIRLGAGLNHRKNQGCRPSPA